MASREPRPRRKLMPEGEVAGVLGGDLEGDHPGLDHQAHHQPHGRIATEPHIRSHPPAEFEATFYAAPTTDPSRLEGQ